MESSRRLALVLLLSALSACALGNDGDQGDGGSAPADSDGQDAAVDDQTPVDVQAPSDDTWLDPVDSSATPDDTDLLTVPEVATLLRLTDKGIYAMVSARRIPFVKVSNRVRFLRADVVQWLRENRVPASGRDR